MAENGGETTFVFKANTQPAENELESFADKLKGNVVALNQGFELVEKAIRGVAAAFDKAVDFAQMGEEIAAIGVRFEAIAGQAGLVPEELSKGIEHALKGTVDMEDALQAASGAIVSLGENAERIPQVFELAKKVTMLYGGSVIEQFEKISLAIASGNARSLKNIGLITDSEKAYDKYAHQVGVAKENLSEAQRQQALMNAVLTAGEEKFKNINSSVTPLSESLKQQKVAFKELGDTAATVFNNVFGEVLKRSIRDTTTSLEILNIKLSEVLLGKKPEAADRLKEINFQLQENIRYQDMAAVRGDTGRIEQLQLEASQLMQQKLIQEQLLNQENTKLALKQQMIPTLNAERDATKDANIEKENELYLLRQGQEEYEKLLKQMGQSAIALGNTIKSALANGIAQSIQLVVKNIMSGKNAFSGFVALVGNIMGELAIQLGIMFIGAGLAIDATKGLFGAGAVVAGVALVAVGSILKALSGSGGGGETSTSAVGSSPFNPTYTADTSSGLTQENERAQAQTGVQVIVQGNVFDSKETGLQIAQILSDSFDTNGTIVRGFA